MIERLKMSVNFISLFTILSVLSLTSILFLTLSGCRQEAIEVEVEKVAGKKGENLRHIKDEVLKDVKYDIQVWIEGDPKKIETVFTENMVNMWKEARSMDAKEEVKRVRVHENQKFEVSDLTKSRPSVFYSFVDKSYFVDVRTGKPKTKPSNKEHTIAIFLIKEDGRYKIDNMVGDSNAIR